MRSGQMEGDPVRYAIENEVGVLEDVEVLLVQGDWSLVDDKLWAMESIKPSSNLKLATDRAVKSSRSKRRKTSSNVPSGWREGGRRIFHQANGGVTDGSFKSTWAVRIGSPDVPFSPPTNSASEVEPSVESSRFTGERGYQTRRRRV